jgi:hypothetical protein
MDTNIPRIEGNSINRLLDDGEDGRDENEIANGEDPRGEVMYKYELTSTGEIRQDGFGITFLWCDRDTNALEGEHSNISNTFGSHSIRLKLLMIF